MGLDTTHGAFHGAYSRFDRFRSNVVKAMGGHWPDHITGDGRWRWGPGYNQENSPGLYLFLCHSDFDGHFTPEECALVARDLEALLPKIEMVCDEAAEHARNFIAGCRMAHEDGENLEFG